MFLSLPPRKVKRKISLFITSASSPVKYWLLFFLLWFFSAVGVLSGIAGEEQGDIFAAISINATSPLPIYWQVVMPMPQQLDLHYLSDVSKPTNEKGYSKEVTPLATFVFTLTPAHLLPVAEERGGLLINVLPLYVWHCVLRL